jgi:acylphosphatase
VLTVLPASTKTKQKEEKKNKLRKQTADWTLRLDSSHHPYSALWAQLGDLHGAIKSHDNKLVRTVIVGKNRQLVEKLIALVSYFIRSGDSVYFDVIQEKFDFDELLLLFKEKRNNSSSSGPPSEATTTTTTTTTTNGDQADKTTEIFMCELEDDDEMSRRNHQVNLDSTPTTVTDDSLLPLTCNAKELPLIGCHLKANAQRSTRMQHNLGYSLMGSYCDQFVEQFVLHGTGDRTFLGDLHEKLLFSKNNSILDSTIDEAIYIVVDVDHAEVKVYSSECTEPMLVDKSIGLVEQMLQSALNMIKLFKNSQFTLLHLEDKLQELYSKSVTFNELKSRLVEQTDSTQSLISLLELTDLNDLEFLKRILTAVI